MNDENTITLSASCEDWQLLAALVRWLEETTDAPVRNGARNGGRNGARDFLQAHGALPRLRKNAKCRDLPITLPAKTWAWLAYGIYEALESLKDAPAQPDWEALGNEMPGPTGWWLASKLDQAQVWPCYLSMSKSVDLRPWYKPFSPQAPTQELRTTRYWQNRGEIPL